MTEQMKILYGHLGCISRDRKVKNLDNLQSVLNASSRKRSLGAPDETIGVAQWLEYHPARIAFLTLAHAKSCLSQSMSIRFNRRQEEVIVLNNRTGPLFLEFN